MTAATIFPAMQRVDAHGLLVVRAAGGVSRLVRLHEEGSAKIRFPRPHGATPDEGLEAVLINTAGGLTGGDRLSWHVEAGAGASLSLTTQACEKVYRASSGTAQVDITIQMGQGTRLAWLPQETIVFDRSAFSRTMAVDLTGDAECLIVESLVLGRKAMGETLRGCAFRDRWRVRVDGRLVHAEDFRFDGDAAGLFAHAATGAGAGAMATILMVGGALEARLGDVRRVMAEHPQTASGASVWTVGPSSRQSSGRSGKLLARIVAEDGYRLRGLLQPLIRLLNGEAGLPKIWSS